MAVGMGDLMANETFDTILSDLDMPGTNGIQFFEKSPQARRGRAGRVDNRKPTIFVARKPELVAS
jgi:CheY-like chemotaxis protein